MSPFIRHKFLLCLLLLSCLLNPAWSAQNKVADNNADADAKIVAELDRVYQQAVLTGDITTMANIYHPDFTLVNGRGKVSNADDWLQSAKNADIRYTHQEVIDNSRKVRVNGDTAVVTGKLWIQGDLKTGGSIDRVVWFSDTYVRTPNGWKYFFGQASLPIPDKSTSHVQLQGAEVDAVRAMNDGHIRAWREHDSQWFRENMAEDFVCTTPSGSILDKQSFIDYPDQSAAIKNSHVEDLLIRVYGDTAIVTGNNVVNWVNGNTSATRYTDTYSKIDGQWKGVSAHLTSVKNNKS